MKNSKDFLEDLYGPVTIGTLLRGYRVRKDLILDDVASILGVSKSYVSDLEHDRKKISLSQAADIAEKLGDSPEVYAVVWIENRLLEAGLRGKIELNVVEVGQRNKTNAQSNKKTTKRKVS